MLKVKHVYQVTDHHCIPACQKMVVEYARKELGVSCQNLSVKRIAKVTKINRDGVAPKDAERINDLLRRSKPPIKFQTLLMAKFDDIIEELSNKRPVIVMMNCMDPPDELLHAVVVVNYELNHISFDGPEVEEEENSIKDLEIGVFMSKWGWKAEMIKLLIGKVQQTTIVDYQLDTENGEDK